MLWLLLRLRQACNHPWLVHGTAAKYGGPGATSPTKALGSPAGKVSQSQLTAAKKLAGPLCQQLLQTLLQEPNVCAQCGDIPEDAVVSACHHVFCQQCITMQVCSPLHCYASNIRETWGQPQYVMLPLCCSNGSCCTGARCCHVLKTRQVIIRISNLFY